MKTVLLTSNSLRHKCIAAQLAMTTDLALVVTESKSPQITNTSGYSGEDAAFLDRHFGARASSEREFFGNYSGFPQNIPALTVEHGKINSPEVFKKITDADPDLIVLFGTSIIKDPLLKEFGGRIINLHLGLSPYYRGSATNLYPYLFEEPECIGATLHLATSEVDKGAILCQLRPEISKEDNLHSIGNRVILETGQILPEVLRKYISGKIEPVIQESSGKLCRISDITPKVLRKIYRNFDKGMIPRYLEDKVERDAKKPIVEQV